MADGFGFGRMTLSGAAEIEKLLAQIPQEVESRRVVKNALRGGARVIRKYARANLKAIGAWDTGTLARTMTIYEKRRGVRGSATVALRASGKVYLVVRKGHKKPTAARPSKYAHLVEYGTEHSRPEPFMRPAVDGHNKEAVAAILESAARGIVREAAKLGLKTDLGI